MCSTLASLSLKLCLFLLCSKGNERELAYFLAAKPRNQSGKLPWWRMCDACVSANHLLTSSFRPLSEASTPESPLLNSSILSTQPETDQPSDGVLKRSCCA